MSNKDLKSTVYDRQVRVWGANAQSLFENSHICLVNASASGTEALKSLILTGVGAFTVVDGAVVTEADLGKNFFVEEADLGKSRATSIVEHLKVHNLFLKPENAIAVHEDPIKLLKTSPEFYSKFSLIIVSSCPSDILNEFTAFCANTDIILINVRNYGQLGIVQSFVKEQCIFDSRITPPFTDFRISNPWKELRDLAESLQPEKLDASDHGRMPWLVLMINALDLWEKQKGKRTISYQERKEFEEMTTQWQKAEYEKAVASHDPSKGNLDFQFSPPFENLDEGMRNIHRLAKVELPDETTHLFRLLEEREARMKTVFDPQEPELRQRFWVLTAALRDFVKANNGLLPVSPTIPDMVSSSLFYGKLRQTFAAKANADAQQMLELTSAYIPATGTGEPLLVMTFEEVYNFSTKAGMTLCLNYAPILTLTEKTESEANAARHSNLATMIGEVPDQVMDYFSLYEPEHNAVWIPLVAAADIFRQRHNRFPGQANSGDVVSEAVDNPRHAAVVSKEDFEKDVEDLRTIVQELCKQKGLSLSIASSDLVRETVRFAGGELHSVSAIVGGVVAQEAFKLLSHLFLPLDNTFVYNGLPGVVFTGKL
ncbi:putative NEDD8-activating enzyme E1 regulatory subunit [Blattamonas nauphoetae]|uniref:NEDD8-activating enzyme E1 regulatory subunit n=1 Tax=Blattamonas nauphoetae TaxID=2049346 RepID=A0ABQ9YKA6_9EUKA|nr:putative NEDD8-activating enzyme E1 regulatory subunit [Blattamonas nauphoetae]